jgi:hypothetical protein
MLCPIYRIMTAQDKVNRSWDCMCTSAVPKTDEAIGDFTELLEQCPALRILVPFDLTDKYADFLVEPTDSAHHAPVGYLAFRRGHLARLTGPIHEFCLNGPHIRPSLTSQYRKDLAETWILASDVQKRFERARIFKGRLAELLFAAHLIESGWRIRDLEAWGSGVDIEACVAEEVTMFEVKHLGVDQITFDLTCAALESGGAAVNSIGVYSPVDYLVFRVYQGARQLLNKPQPKIVAVILDDYAQNYEIPLRENWVDWNAPGFFRREADIEPLLKREFAKNPKLIEELGPTISTLSEIWFMEQHSPFLLKTRKVVQLRRKA